MVLPRDGAIVDGLHPRAGNTRLEQVTATPLMRVLAGCDAEDLAGGIPLSIDVLVELSRRGDLETLL